jgi:outer membrane receptor protein involved in Fe transport
LAAWAAWPLLLAAAGASAQPEPEAGQRVEVLGVTPLPGLDIPKDRFPANVQTARGAEIERSHATDLSAFMNRRLGSVHINEVQGNAFQPDVNFRGFTASPLLGTAQGLSVYLDGVRLNQAFGDVVSWDLIPKSAIASIALMPGSNPLFGLNTLGGALSVQTKDGVKNPGSSVQLQSGSHGRAAAEFETGGGQVEGLNWFVTGHAFRDAGWRADSPSRVGQVFGKFGFKAADTTMSLTAALAGTDLNGNGLQEARLLAKDWGSVYTKPDNTRNRAALLNLAASHGLSNGWSLSGNFYWRHITTKTSNGDVNNDALGQAVYQPDAAEQAALAAAGYSGFPAAGENAANTPFPRWRCIANALRQDAPGEQCNGVINQSDTTQTNAGFSAQLNGEGKLVGLARQWVAGVAYDASRVRFLQGPELGYLNPDHSITGVGAFGDGVTGGNLGGVPYDTRVDLSARTRTASVYASDVLALNPQTHLTLSGRYNRTTVTNRDAITPGGGAGSLAGDQVFRRFNPAIGLTFAASKQLTVYGGLNQGSRAPSAVELGCADPANPCKLPNAMAGDPPLRQVVTTTLEAGLRGQVGGSAGSTVWNLGLFRADNRDDILFVADNAAGFGYFKNFGKTRRQGLEAGFSTVLAGATLGANFTLLDATFQSDEVLNGAGNSSNDQAQAGFPGLDGNIRVRAGNRLPLVPRKLLKLFAEMPLGAAFSVGADVSAVAASTARGNENNGHQSDGRYYLGAGRSAGYAVLNLSGDWRPQWPQTGGLTLFAQVNNLLDRRYSTAAQLGATAFDANGKFVARPFSANANGDRPLVGSSYYAPGAPRSITLGLRYRFGA